MTNDDSSPVSRVDAQIRDYIEGDADRFAAHYAPDAVCFQMPEGKAIATGRADIARVWGALFQRRKATVEITHRIALGEMVIDHERVTNLSTGQTIEAIAAYRVCDDLIQTVWFLGPAFPVTNGD